MFENFAAKLKKMREAKGEEENVTFKPFPEEESAKVKVEEKAEEPKKLPPPIEAKAEEKDANIELKVVRPSTFEERVEAASAEKAKPTINLFDIDI